MMGFHKKSADCAEDHRTVLEAHVQALEDAPSRKNDEAADSKQKRKSAKLRLLIAFGILLIFGFSLRCLVPYAKKIHGLTYDLAPSILANGLLLPIFWSLLGWTIMQASGVFGLVSRKRTRAGGIVRIAVLTMILAYAAVMVPFMIETVHAAILQLRYLQAVYPPGFFYAYHLPIFLQSAAAWLLRVSYKPGIFTALGVLLWLSGREKRRRPYKTAQST